MNLENALNHLFELTKFMSVLELEEFIKSKMYLPEDSMYFLFYDSVIGAIKKFKEGLI